VTLTGEARRSRSLRGFSLQHPRWRGSLGERSLCEQHPRWRRSQGETSLCEHHPRCRRILGTIAQILHMSLSRDADPAGTAKQSKRIPSRRWQVVRQSMGRICSAASLEARLGGMSRVIHNHGLGRPTVLGPIQAHGIHNHGLGRRRSLCGRFRSRRGTRRRRGGRRTINPRWRRVSAV
jgi:hypothetical protein